MKIISKSHTHNLPVDVLALVAKTFEGRDAFFIERLTLPDGLLVDCDLYGPLMNDKPVSSTDAHGAKRGDREYLSRVVDRDPRKVDHVTVIAGPDGDDPCVLYTVFGGPITPKEPNDPTLSEVERDYSASFWSEHALACPAELRRDKPIRTIMFPVATHPIPITLSWIDGMLLKSLYAHISCDLVERIGIDDGIDILVDEMGRINGRTYNRTWLVKRNGEPSGTVDICGHAIVLALVDVPQPEGYTEQDWGQPTAEQLVTACTLVGALNGAAPLDSHRNPTDAQIRAWLTEGIDWTQTEAWTSPAVEPKPEPEQVAPNGAAVAMMIAIATTLERASVLSGDADSLWRHAAMQLRAGQMVDATFTIEKANATSALAGEQINKAYSQLKLTKFADMNWWRSVKPDVRNAGIRGAISVLSPEQAKVELAVHLEGCSGEDCTVTTALRSASDPVVHPNAVSTQEKPSALFTLAALIKPEEMK